jgi:hypothetical protein
MAQAASYSHPKLRFASIRRSEDKVKGEFIAGNGLDKPTQLCKKLTLRPTKNHNELIAQYHIAPREAIILEIDYRRVE